MTKEQTFQMLHKVAHQIASELGYRYALNEHPDRSSKEITYFTAKDERIVAVHECICMPAITVYDVDDGGYVRYIFGDDNHKMHMRYVKELERLCPDVQNISHVSQQVRNELQKKYTYRTGQYTVSSINIVTGDNYPYVMSLAELLDSRLPKEAFGDGEWRRPN